MMSMAFLLVRYTLAEIVRPAMGHQQQQQVEVQVQQHQASQETVLVPQADGRITENKLAELETDKMEAVATGGTDFVYIP